MSGAVPPPVRVKRVPYGVFSSKNPQFFRKKKAPSEAPYRSPRIPVRPVLSQENRASVTSFQVPSFRRTHWLPKRTERVWMPVFGSKHSRKE